MRKSRINLEIRKTFLWLAWVGAPSLLLVLTPAIAQKPSPRTPPQNPSEIEAPPVPKPKPSRPATPPPAQRGAPSSAQSTDRSTSNPIEDEWDRRERLAKELDAERTRVATQNRQDAEDFKRDVAQIFRDFSQSRLEAIYESSFVTAPTCDLLVDMSNEPPTQPRQPVLWYEFGSFNDVRALGSYSTVDDQNKLESFDEVKARAQLVYGFQLQNRFACDPQRPAAEGSLRYDFQGYIRFVDTSSAGRGSVGIRKLPVQIAGVVPSLNSLVFHWSELYLKAQLPGGEALYTPNIIPNAPLSPEVADRIECKALPKDRYKFHFMICRTMLVGKNPNGTFAIPDQEQRNTRGGDKSYTLLTDGIRFDVSSRLIDDSEPRPRR